LHLCALLRSHGVEHRLSCCHAPSHRLEQFIKSLGILGKEVSKLLHKPVKVRLFAALALLQHFIQRRHHVFGAG